MRICLATTHYTPVTGGISLYYTCLSRLLTEAGHSVILLTTGTGDNDADDSIEEEGLFTKITLNAGYQRYLRYYNVYFRPGGYAAGKWMATGMAMREWLVKNAVAYQIDLIETMDFGGAGIFLKQEGFPPLIIDAHSSALQIDQYAPMLQDDHLAVIQKLEKLSFKYADAIIAHSPMNQSALKAMGFHQTFFSRAPWQLPGQGNSVRNPHSNHFLVVSSLQMIKGAELMIRAAAIAGKTLDSLRIYWVGEDSYSAPGAAQTSDFLQKKYPATWKNHFIWLGPKNRDEIALLMSETSAVIIPSLWDTFNYVVPETIFTGTPLIVSDKTGAAYLVQEHPLATLFKAGDAEELARILHHFTPPGKTDSPTSYKSVAHYFNPTAIIAERMHIYNTVLMDRAQPDMPEIKNGLQFLSTYINPRRKIYYWLRKKLKALIRPDFNKLGH